MIMIKKYSIPRSYRYFDIILVYSRQHLTVSRYRMNTLGRRSNFVELFTGSSPWSNTEFWQFSRNLLKTRNIWELSAYRDASWVCAINPRLSLTLTLMTHHHHKKNVSVITTVNSCSCNCTWPYWTMAHRYIVQAYHWTIWGVHRILGLQ